MGKEVEAMIEPVRISGDDYTTLWHMQRAEGMVVLDSLMEFEVTRVSLYQWTLGPYAEEFLEMPVGAELPDELLEGGVYSHSRLHADPRLSLEADEIWERSIKERALSLGWYALRARGELAGAIIVEGERVLNFWLRPEFRGLFADGHRHRLRLGTRFLSRLGGHLLYEKGLAKVEIGTQPYNIAAVKTILLAGFTPVRFSYTLHPVVPEEWT
jgi:hypothetical protein